MNAKPEQRELEHALAERPLCVRFTPKQLERIILAREAQILDQHTVIAHLRDKVAARERRIAELEAYLANEGPKP